MKVLSNLTPLFLLLSLQANAVVGIEGKVQEIDISAEHLAIEDQEVGVLQNVKIKGDTNIETESKRLNRLDSLSVGEEVVFKNKSEQSKSIKYISAKIQELDKVNREVTFVNTKTGEVQTYSYDPAAVRAKNRRDIDISNIKPGQKVELQVVTR